MVTIHDAIAIAITADGTRAKAEFAAVGKSAKTHLDATSKSSKDLSGTLTKVGVGAVGAGLAIAGGLLKASGAASDLAESTSKSKVVFGDAAGAAEKFAKSASKIGLSKQAALEAAGSFGVLFTGIGKSSTEAEKMSERMVGLAADLASFNNTSVDEALLALQSGLRGEAEPLRRFGVLLDDATLRQAALKDGLISTTKQALTPAQKAQAAYGAILGQTSKQQGDFARTADGMANKQRVLKAEFDNLEAALGTAAVPAMKAFADVGLEAAAVFTDLNDVTHGGIGAIAGYSAAALVASGTILTVVGQVKKLKVAYQETAVAQKLAQSGVGLGAAAGVVAFAAGATALGKALSRSGGQSIKDFKTGLESLTGTVHKSTLELNKATDGALQDYLAKHTDVVKALNAEGLSTEDLQAGLQGDKKAWLEVTAALEKHNDAGGRSKTVLYGIGQSYAKAKEGVKAYNEDQAIANRNQEAGERTAKRFGPAIVAAGQAMEKEADAAHKAAERVSDLADAQFDLRDSARGIATGQLDIADAVADIAQRETDLAKARHDGKTPAAELAQMERDLARAKIELGGTLDDVAQKYLDEAALQVGASDATDAATGRTNAYKLKLLEIVGTLQGPLREAILAYIATLDQIPTEKTTTFHLQGTGIRGVRAAGGPVSAGGTYLVGEKGPELFTPRSSGTIIPNDRLSRAGASSVSSGGVAGTNHYTLNVSSLDPRQSKDLILAALKEIERARGSVPIKVA